MDRQDGGSRCFWEPGPRLKSAGRGVLDLIFPPQTLDPGERPQSPGLSAEAWSRIVFIDGPVCDGCGAPFEFSPGPGIRCPACEARPRAFDRARAACVYDEASRDPILHLKHADRLDIAPLLARWLSRAAIRSWRRRT
jgi:predicted amidophosphoribosyltransferase